MRSASLPARRVRASFSGRGAAVVPLLGLAVLAAGCGSSATTTTPTSAPAPASATVPSTTVAAPTTTAPSATTTSVAASTVPPAAAQCLTAHLAGRLGAPDGTAGGVDFTLELTNSGTSPCVITGYPGVSTVAGSNGTQVGAAAYRVEGPTPQLRLQPGHRAVATVSLVDPGNFPSTCKVTAALGLRVYPPDNTAALFVPRDLSTCRSTRFKALGVGPFHAG